MLINYNVDLEVEQVDRVDLVAQAIIEFLKIRLPVTIDLGNVDDTFGYSGYHEIIWKNLIPRHFIGLDTTQLFNEEISNEEAWYDILSTISHELIHAKQTEQLRLLRFSEDTALWCGKVYRTVGLDSSFELYKYSQPWEAEAYSREIEVLKASCKNKPNLIKEIL